MLQASNGVATMSDRVRETHKEDIIFLFYTKIETSDDGQVVTQFN